MLREPVDQYAWPTVAVVSCDTPVVLGKGARQGAPGTLTMWIYVVTAFTLPLIQSWEGEAPLEWCPARVPWSIFGTPIIPMFPLTTR